MRGGHHQQTQSKKEVSLFHLEQDLRHSPQSEKFSTKPINKQQIGLFILEN